MKAAVLTHWYTPKEVKKAGYKTGQLIPGKEVLKVIKDLNEKGYTTMLVPISHEKRNVLYVGISKLTHF